MRNYLNTAFPFWASSQNTAELTSKAPSMSWQAQPAVRFLFHVLDSRWTAGQVHSLVLLTVPTSSPHQQQGLLLPGWLQRGSLLDFIWPNIKGSGWGYALVFGNWSDTQGWHEAFVTCYSGHVRLSAGLPAGSLVFSWGKFHGSGLSCIGLRLVCSHRA